MTAVFFWGMVSGGCVAGLAAWLSMPILIRRGVSGELREIRRISRGLPDTGEQFALNDRDGALAQAQSAYIPVYPGAGKEPDADWIAWVRGRPAFFAIEEHTDAWEAGDAPTVTVPRPHTPRHAAPDSPVVTPDPEPTGPIYPVWPTVVTDATPPRWGEPPPGQIDPLRWRRWELGLACAILGGSRLSAATGRRIRAVIDGLWLALAVFESSGQRINRAFLESVDDILEGVYAVVSTAIALAIAAAAVVLDLSATLTDRATRFGRILATPLIGRPSRLRPKRYYPIKES